MGGKNVHTGNPGTKKVGTVFRECAGITGHFSLSEDLPAGTMIQGILRRKKTN